MPEATAPAAAIEEPASSSPAKQRGCTSAQWKKHRESWPADYPAERAAADLFNEARWYPDVAAATLGDAIGGAP